jgi:hypothetical protein
MAVAPGFLKIMVMNSSSYKWEITLSEVRLKPRKKVDYAGIRWLLNGVKSMIKKESDPAVKEDLAKAGMALNKILIKY